MLFHGFGEIVEQRTATEVALMETALDEWVTEREERRCNRCGALYDAASIHFCYNAVTQEERIANALEKIVELLEQICQE